MFATLLTLSLMPLAGPDVHEHLMSEHAAIRPHLAHVEALLVALPTQAPDKAQASMQQVRAFFSDHILPHAGQEETGLYQTIDKHVGCQPPITATMRHDHVIVGRWTGELGKISDPKAFSTKGLQLLGLVTAHFEKEEVVLLPLLKGH